MDFQSILSKEYYGNTGGVAEGVEGGEHLLLHLRVVGGDALQGLSALGLLFIYYIEKGADILRTQTEVNLAILREFNARGLEFAFPTQTIYAQGLGAPAS